MNHTLTLAVAQPFCLPGDVEGNLRRMRPQIQQAARGKARLVLFSECGLTGYESSPRCLDHAVTVGDSTCDQLLAWAKKYGIVISAGFFEKNGRSIFNSQGVFYPDGTLIVQRKAGLSPLDNTIPNIKAGPEKRTVFLVDGVRCAISICSDSTIPDLYNRIAAQGVQLLLSPTAGLGPRSKGFSEADLNAPDRLEQYLKSAESVVFQPRMIERACTHRIAIASCNQMADDGKVYFHCGHSMIIDGTGELVQLIPGVFIFEHLRPRVLWGTIHPQTPRLSPHSNNHRR